MIDYIFINNYKSFVNFRTDFNQLNLLMGKNGAGKSNLLLIVKDLCAFIRGGLGVNTATIFSYSAKTRWMNSNIQTFEVRMSDKEHTYLYRLEIEQDKERNYGVVSLEKVMCDDKLIYHTDKGVTRVYDDNGLNERIAYTDMTMSGVNVVPADEAHNLLHSFKNVVNRIVYCSIDPKRMYDYIENDISGPNYDFSNIASTFVALQMLYPDSYQDIKAAMQEIDPTFQGVHTMLAQSGKYLAADYLFDGVKVTLRFDELSDGEKMLFALYLILYGLEKNGFVVLLDEPDNYISLREIQPWCVEMENLIQGENQMIIVSHHPEMIDYLATSYGIWFDRLKSGESVVVDDPYYKKEEAQFMTYSELIARRVIDEA